MTFKIISDSSCDLEKDYLQGKDIGFDIVPFVVNVLGHEFIDDSEGSKNVVKMLALLSTTQEKTSTACPSPQTYYEAMTADVNFVVTISSQLSGSYNSACVAQKMAEEEGKKVYVIDSKATCGVQTLIVDKLVQLIESGLSFEDICLQIQKYTDERNLVFVLKNFDNLIRNGRVLKIVAKLAVIINLNPVCIKSPDGNIEIKEKIIGNKKTLRRMVEIIGETTPDLDGKEIIISHCLADIDAETIREKILATYPQIKGVRVVPTKLLASYYALDEGVIVSY